MTNTENKNIESKKKDLNKKTVRAGAIGVATLSMVFAIAGASSFFTDTDHIDTGAKIGNFDMTVDDKSDLDGNYRNWSDRLTSTTKLVANGQQADDWTLPTTADKDIGRNDSTGIVNPGDTGILAFKVTNTGKKSMDTAAMVTVEVQLADGAYDDTTRGGTKVIAYDKDGKSLTTSPAVAGASSTYNVENAKLAVDSSDKQSDLALLADTTTDQGKTDAGAYTIEGLGTPVVYQGRFEKDARGEYTDHLIDTDKNVITLRYYTTLETLAGSVEKNPSKETDATSAKFDDSHAAGNSAIYAYNADFDRAITNKFQNANIKVNCEVFAKQHRDSFVADLDFVTIDGYQGSAAVAEGQTIAGVYNQKGSAQTANTIAIKGVAAEEEVNGTAKDNTQHTKAVKNTNGQSLVRSNCNQTHVISAGVPRQDLASDWSMIQSFSHVINGSVE